MKQICLLAILIITVTARPRDQVRYGKPWTTAILLEPEIPEQTRKVQLIADVPSIQRIAQLSHFKTSFTKGEQINLVFQFSCYKILTKIFGRIESCPKEKESFEQNVPTTSISKYKWFLGYGKISFMVLVTGLIITILKTQIWCKILSSDWRW